MKEEIIQIERIDDKKRCFKKRKNCDGKQRRIPIQIVKKCVEGFQKGIRKSKNEMQTIGIVSKSCKEKREGEEERIIE